MTGVTGRALAITIYTAQQLGELAKAFSAIQANFDISSISETENSNWKCTNTHCTDDKQFAEEK